MYICVYMYCTDSVHVIAENSKCPNLSCRVVESQSKPAILALVFTVKTKIISITTAGEIVTFTIKTYLNL